MGGGGQRYGSDRLHLTRAEIKATHRNVDSYAYVFDSEYERLKEEESQLSEMDNGRRNLQDRVEDVQEQIDDLRRSAFTPDSVATSQTYNGFKAENHKGPQARIVEMSPSEYLRRAAFGENGRGSLDAILNSASPTQVEKYMRQMVRGTKFKTPTLGRTGKTTIVNNERVYAAMMNGYDRIPVLIV